MQWIASIFLLFGFIFHSQDEGNFTNDLTKIHDLMAQGKWSPALNKLEVLLEEYKEQPYVKARWIEIEENFKRCLFHSTYQVPELDDLVAGQLLS